MVGLQKQEGTSPNRQVFCVMIANVSLTKASPTVKENHRAKSRVNAGRDHTRAWIQGARIIGDY